jgi:hypothetical protein
MPRQIPWCNTNDQGDGPSYEPSISDDGRFVAFMSSATNLVPGDTNNSGDIFFNRLSSAQVVSLAAGQDLDGIDFGGYSGASVSGQAFWDMNNNGVRDAGEPASGGWTVFLDQDGDGQRDPAEASTVTDSDGRYAFTGLLAGDYQVREILPPGWSLTLPGGVYDVTLAFGDAQAGLDFGNAAILDQLKKSGGNTLPAAEVAAFVTSADNPQAGLAVWSTMDNADASGPQILVVTPILKNTAILEV